MYYSTMALVPVPQRACAVNVGLVLVPQGAWGGTAARL